MPTIDVLKPTLLCLFVATALAAAESAEPLNYGQFGSVSCKSGPCWNKVMASLPAQKLLLTLAADPREPAEIDAALQGTGVTREALEKLGLVRRQGNHYMLNFTLWTRNDVSRVKEVSERHARSLAAEFLARRSHMEGTLRKYPLHSVDPGAVAFIVLGCFSLDWDGLRLTAERGYRKPEQDDKRPDGRYTPHASEREDMPHGRVYWGSNTNWYGKLAMTGFGDHTTPDRISSAIGSQGQRFSRIMLALREREQTLPELAQAAGLTPNEAQVAIDKLTRLDWLTSKEGRYRPKIPVFSRQDREMIQESLRTGREAMNAWLASDYEGMRAELADLAPARWGVGYNEQFSLIWHFVFGITNRLLIEAGFFAKPYAFSQAYKGYIPTVFEGNIW
jgi:hypothetical protein